MLSPLSVYNETQMSSVPRFPVQRTHRKVNPEEQRGPSRANGQRKLTWRLLSQRQRNLSPHKGLAFRELPRVR